MQKQGKRDREVYSRQELILGANGLRKLHSSSLCVIGVDGLACEFVKNILLAGVPRVYLFDSKPVARLDVSTNVCFFLSFMNLLTFISFVFGKSPFLN